MKTINEFITDMCDKEENFELLKRQSEAVLLLRNQVSECIKDINAAFGFQIMITLLITFYETTVNFFNIYTRPSLFSVLTELVWFSMASSRLVIIFMSSTLYGLEVS